MNITRNNLDALNAVVTVEIAKADYASKVEATLKNYAKTANIPGFRKGNVPFGMVKKQYGKAILFDEVNKLLQENLNQYLVDEKLDILGNPLPRINENFNWDADDFTFEFELGLAPTFEVNLDAAKNVVNYKIVADDQLLEDQVTRIRKQYGKMSPAEEVGKDSDVSGTFLNAEKNIDAPAQINAGIFKDKKTWKAFEGKKVGDVVTVNTKGLFDDDHKLMDYLRVGHDLVHGLAVDVDFKIEEITNTEPAELNQELFDKLFGAGNVSSVEDIKAKIKEDAERQFAQQSEQKFLNDVTESLLQNTTFDLPSEFLKKWLQTAGEQPLTPEQAAEEFAKSENGLRYQLIEGKIMSQNNLQITFEDLKAYTAELIKKQMAQFGQMDPSDADVDNIVARVLSNQEEVKRLSEQVMSQKMLNLFKEKVKAKTKEVTYQEFIAASYGE